MAPTLVCPSTVVEWSARRSRRRRGACRGSKEAVAAGKRRKGRPATRLRGDAAEAAARSGFPTPVRKPIRDRPLQGETRARAVPKLRGGAGALRARRSRLLGEVLSAPGHPSSYRHRWGPVHGPPTARRPQPPGNAIPSQRTTSLILTSRRGVCPDVTPRPYPGGSSRCLTAPCRCPRRRRPIPPDASLVVAD